MSISMAFGFRGLLPIRKAPGAAQTLDDAQRSRGRRPERAGFYGFLLASNTVSSTGFCGFLYGFQYGFREGSYNFLYGFQ